MSELEFESESEKRKIGGFKSWDDFSVYYGDAVNLAIAHDA